MLNTPCIFIVTDGIHSVWFLSSGVIDRCGLSVEKMLNPSFELLVQIVWCEICTEECSYKLSNQNGGHSGNVQKCLVVKVNPNV